MLRLPVLLFVVALYSSCNILNPNADLPQTKLLWRTIEFDEKFGIALNKIVLNMACIDTLSDQEKAAIAYLAAPMGNDCDWEDPNIQRADNLKCVIISALDLGYQCSDGHVGLIKKWFKTDEKVMSQINDCELMPRTSTSLNGFYYINLARNKNIFIVTYDGFGIGTTNRIGFEWSAEVIFELKEDEVVLLDFNETRIHEAPINVELYGQIHLEHPYKVHSPDLLP